MTKHREKFGFAFRTVCMCLAAGWLVLSCVEASPLEESMGGKPVRNNSSDYEKGYRLSSTGYDGVDLLVVIDNSGSMAEEQQILATQFFPMINRLTRPEQGDPGWSFPAVENLKVAFVTSDMGLQFGENGDIGLSPAQVSTCEDPLGDNGSFMTVQTPNISIGDGVIECVPYSDQCPANFECREDGFCYSKTGISAVACPNDNSAVLSTAATAPNSDIAIESACMAFQGTEGCGFEQPLEAMVRGLEVHPDFVEDNHVLAVIVVSDEEDCSIENPALFSTDTWKNTILQNTACNVPEGEVNLFDPSRYHDKLVAAKDGLDEALVFSAIVGVPNDGGEATCEGTGAELADSGCLDRDEMQIEPVEFSDPTGNMYIHFAPSCTRTTPGGQIVTQARPGRRFVKAAEDFGVDGLVHSICNEDWSDALHATGEAVAEKLTHPCFPYRAPWAETGNGQGAVDDTCDLFIEYKGDTEEMYNFECPSALYAALGADDREAYLAKTLSENDPDTNEIRIYCAIPKIEAPLFCDALAGAQGLSDSVGWTYCENDGRCDFAVDATPAVREIAAGHFFAYRCIAPIE